MSDIDWSKAPEGAEYFYKQSWYKMVNTGLFIYKTKKGPSFTSGDYHWADCGYHHSLTEKMTPKPSKPTFTKAMADNGELPLVGMECMVFNSAMAVPEYEKCTVLFAGKFGFVYNSESCNERYGRVDVLSFKPIEPPIELLDGKAYLFTFGGLDLVAFYIKDLDCFGNNLATYHTSKCTNIVLLTPEVKS